MTYFRLKDTHPVKEKFDKLCELADELGIKITWSNYSTEISVDGFKETFELRDMDSGEVVYEFPPCMEYKLIVDKED